MDQDDVADLGFQSLEAVGHRILPPLPAPDDGADLAVAGGVFPALSGMGQDENDGVYEGIGLEGGQAPVQDRPSAQGGELLGAAEPPAFTGGHDHGPDPAHFSSL